MSELLSKLKPNPKNPRIIKKDEFARLKKKIKDFPEMLEKRPIVYDENFIVLGGNMRLRVLRELEKEGFEIKDSYFKSAEGWTEEQKRNFVINDNIADGEWDYDLLANEWDDLPLEEWGVGVLKKEEEIEGEVKFTEELLEEHNYVVLYFDNEIDWLNLQSLFPLSTVQALDSKKGYEKKGVGRVIKGVDFINKIKE
jgi:hypothetical protein